MHSNTIIKNRLDRILFADKVSRKDSFSRLVKREIYNTISTFAIIHEDESFVDVEYSAKGFVVNSKITASPIKHE